MINEQLYLAMGVPSLINIGLITFLYLALTANLNERFKSVEKRFDDMRELWRAELRRVEEVLDARLKHVEEALEKR